MKEIKFLREIKLMCEFQYNRIEPDNLYNGKLGLLVFLFHFARFSDDERLLGELRVKLEYMWETLEKKPRTLDFRYGILGMGFGVDYLLRNRFLGRVSTSDFFDFDLFLFERRLPLSRIDCRKKESFTDFLYFANRLSSSFELGTRQHVSFLKGALIHLVDDAAEIIKSKRFFSKNSYSIPFLCAVLSFLMNVHSHGVSVRKTERLIETVLIGIGDVEAREICISDLSLIHKASELVSIRRNSWPETCSVIRPYKLPQDCTSYNRLAKHLLIDGNFCMSASELAAISLNTTLTLDSGKFDSTFEAGLAGVGFFIIKLIEART